MKTHTIPRIGGMLIGYYLICPRKAWLSLRGLWMEQESDTVAIGRQLDEQSYGREVKHIELEALAPCGTGLVGKIDWANLKTGVLHETKKGRSCEEAHRWQLRFYLWLLKLNGVCSKDGSPFNGMLDYPTLRRREHVSLSTEEEVQLAAMIRALRQLAMSSEPPERLSRRSFCKTCAFEELCYG